MARGKALLGCYIYVIGLRDKAHPKLSNWVNHLSGVYEWRLSEKTTHAVVSDKGWKKPGTKLEEVLERKAQGQNIKIVSYAWVNDCCTSGCKKAEKPYLWESLDVNSSRAHGKAAGSGDSGARSAAGMMAEVLQESTDPFISDRHREAIDRKLAAEKERNRQLTEERKREKLAALKRSQEQAKVFGIGARKARNKIFSDNHHVYTDDTGFKYDVLVTKVDTARNRNERSAITIYESNHQPHTYAVNCEFSGTARLPSNKIVCAIGTSFEAAFRIFKEVFKEKTRVDWDARLSHHLDRREQIQSGDCVSSVGQSGEESFETKPFQYHLPELGPKGRLSAKDQLRLEQYKSQRRQAKSQRVVDEYTSVHRGGSKTEARGGRAGGPALMQGGADLDHDVSRLDHVDRPKGRQDHADTPLQSPRHSERSYHNGSLDNSVDQIMGEIAISRDGIGSDYSPNEISQTEYSSAHDLSNVNIENHRDVSPCQPYTVDSVEDIADKTNQFGYVYDSAMNATKASLGPSILGKRKWLEDSGGSPSKRQDYGTNVSDEPEEFHFAEQANHEENGMEVVDAVTGHEDWGL